MFQNPNGPQIYAPRPTGPYRSKTVTVQGYPGAAGQHYKNVALGKQQRYDVNLGRNWTQAQDKFSMASQDMNNRSMLESLQLLLTQNANANQRLAAYEKFAPGAIGGLLTDRKGSATLPARTAAVPTGGVKGTQEQADRKSLHDEQNRRLIMTRILQSKSPGADKRIQLLNMGYKPAEINELMASLGPQRQTVSKPSVPRPF